LGIWQCILAVQQSIFKNHGFLVKGDRMMLCSHIYIKVHRTIRNNAQIFSEKEQFIKIYEDRVTTATEDFDIKDILDISFKEMSGTRSFLYLHTTRGLFAYVTNIPPTRLIKIFRELKNRN
jgi:hypothetical protein